MLKLNLGPDVFVSKESNIKVIVKSNTSTSEDGPDHPDVSSSSSSSISIELTIEKGNVFHPGSNLFILVPDNDENNEGIVKHCRIGENNLLEERCNITLDIRNDPLYESSEGMMLIGSNNKFSPFCQVTTSKIGNANIFEAACSVQCFSIGNGNVVAPMVHIQKDDDDLLQNGETVLYNLGDMSATSPGNIIPQKRHLVNGVHQNKNEVEILRKAAQKSLIQHHTLLEQTS